VQAALLLGGEKSGVCAGCQPFEGVVGFEPSQADADPNADVALD
jgi:hypothetical protein